MKTGDGSPAAIPATRKAFTRYCAALGLLPVICLVGAVLIARSTWYLRHQRNSYLAISDYAFTLQNANCDVVIYGDSSALTGVAPRVVESRTGLRTCNIAQPNTTLAVAGTFALDSYLLRNAGPRFLIFQFVAPNFAPVTPNVLYEEGTLQLVRHKTDRQTLWLFAGHPLQALEFSRYIWRTALFERDSTAATYRRAWARFQASGGLFTTPGGPLEACAGSLEVIAPDAAWIAELRRRYSHGGTRVLVYASPYPECDGSFNYYADKLRNIVDRPLQRFDIHYFNEKNHFTREGAEENSRQIAEDVLFEMGNERKQADLQNWK
jgi:hypothetical protein